MVPYIRQPGHHLRIARTVAHNHPGTVTTFPQGPIAHQGAGTRRFAFGGVKGRLTGIHPLLGGLQTLGIGTIAATAAFGIA